MKKLQYVVPFLFLIVFTIFFCTTIFFAENEIASATAFHRDYLETVRKVNQLLIIDEKICRPEDVICVA